jgi:uncharacterized protein YjbI with pentapeptide repeats
MPSRTLEELPWAPYLEPWNDWLERDERYETQHFADFTFNEETAADGSRFFECCFSGVTFNAGSYDKVQFRETWVNAARWIGSSAIGSEWLDTEINGSLLAGVQMFDSALRRVTLYGCKLDSVNLRGSKLQEVTFVDCQLKHVDFSGATLTGVTFAGCQLEGVTLERCKLKKVDFSAATQLDLAAGYEALSGATISTNQLMDLAPALAQTFGISIKDS